MSSNKFEFKKYVPLVVVVIVLLGIVGLYLIGRASEERKRDAQDVVHGRENAQDLLHQLDKLEDKSNGNSAPDKSRSEPEQEQAARTETSLESDVAPADGADRDVSTIYRSNGRNPFSGTQTATETSQESAQESPASKETSTETSTDTAQ